MLARLGMVHMAMGNWHNAAEALGQGLLLDPSNKAMVMHTAFCLIHTCRAPVLLDRSLPLFLHAVQLFIALVLHSSSPELLP